MDLEDVPLVCHACGETATLADGERCSCGEPYWIDTDSEGFTWPMVPDRSMWRYSDLLPCAPPAGLAAGVGGTPSVRAPRLDADLGATVHVKVESANPTGTFKDRGSAVGVAAVDAGLADAVGTVSSGNMARSTAAIAAGEGVDCVVFVPADVPIERLRPIARHSPTIVRVEGAGADLRSVAGQAGREHGIHPVSADSPLRVAGQKTTAMEIAGSFAPELPDAVVMPVSSGGHASAVWKGFRELRNAGRISEIPRLYLAQAAACSPIAEAYAAAEHEVEPVDPGETVARSIADPDPSSGQRALKAVYETGGEVVGVPDGATLEARAALADRVGLFVETACATPLAAARHLAETGALDPIDDLVLVATGTGYTEREIADDAPAVDAPSVPVDELDRALGTIAGD